VTAPRRGPGRARDDPQWPPATALLGAHSQQRDELGGAPEGVGDHLAGLDRHGGLDPVPDLGDQQPPGGHAGRIPLGKQPQPVRVVLAGGTN